MDQPFEDIQNHFKEKEIYLAANKVELIHRVTRYMKSVRLTSTKWKDSIGLVMMIC
jgi:hypothetical protein